LIDKKKILKGDFSDLKVNMLMKKLLNFIGEMAEWFKAHAWKVCVLLKVPRVRIPVSPPELKKPFKIKVY
tara:strand:- start:153 stop:362 length:210 start_codon:yes stop_codon:yes gene_type:complete